MPNLPSSQATHGGRYAPLFGNDHCSVVLAGADADLSQRRDRAITRWREDVTCDDWGSLIAPRNMDRGVLWSPARKSFAACKAPR